MTAKAKKNLIAQKSQLLVWIGEIDRAIQDIAIKGVASASLSAANGSQSYTRLNLAELQTLRADYVQRVEAINRRFAGGNPLGIRRIMISRS